MNKTRRQRAFMDTENRRLKEIISPRAVNRKEEESPKEKTSRSKPDAAAGAPRYMSPIRPKGDKAQDAKDAKYQEGKVKARQQPMEYKNVKDDKTAAETRETRKFVVGKNKSGSKKPRQKMMTELHPYNQKT